jgi:sodium/potassium-transporting ATPase subunit alpha
MVVVEADAKDLEAQGQGAMTDIVAEDDLPPALADKRRIRYVDDGEFHEPRAHYDEFGFPLDRRLTAASSMSIRSTRSVRSMRIVDPALALPIQYRTVSFNISNSQERSLAQAKGSKEKATKDLTNIDWHKISISEIYERLSTSPTHGLTAAEVKSKTTEFGRNVPTPPPSHMFRKIFGYFFGGFGSILLVGSILVFVSWKPLGQPPAQANLALAIVLVAVFIIQAAFNAWQDFSSSRVMSSITGMLPEACFVLRDGLKQSIQAADVVPGDILFFNAGSKLPADVRFVEVSSDAKFDRSILTGESLPLGALVESTDDNYLETKCIGMQGTHCTSGQGLGVVVVF